MNTCEHTDSQGLGPALWQRCPIMTQLGAALLSVCGYRGGSSPCPASLLFSSRSLLVLLPSCLASLLFSFLLSASILCFALTQPPIPDHTSWEPHRTRLLGSHSLPGSRLPSQGHRRHFTDIAFRQETPESQLANSCSGTPGSP